MKNKIFGLACFLLAILILSGCNQEKEKKLIIGISPDYPPFAFEYNQELIGFDVDLAKAICSRLDYQVEFKKTQFENLFLSLENKNVDLIVSAISKTDERNKKFDFSHSYYSPKFALIYKRENSKQVHSVDEVEGSIGVEKGTTMSDDIRYHFSDHENEELQNEESQDNNKKSSNIHKTNINSAKLSLISEKIEKNENLSDIKNTSSSIDETNKDLEKHQIKLYDNHSDLLKALEKDEVAAIFTEVLQAEVATQNNRDLTFIPIDHLDDHQHDYHYGFVFNKGSKLTEKFNKILDEMDSEGKIDILKLRWFSGYGVYDNFGKK
jgi:ABC-type amino acid transport substrate-binding protein